MAPRIEFDEWADVDGHRCIVRHTALPTAPTEREAYAALLAAIGDLEARVRLAALRAGYTREQLARSV